MARVESQALGGYFPTQDEVLPLILRRFTKVNEPGTYCVVDPCAGEGAAAAAFALAAFGLPSVYNKPGTRPEGVELQVRFVELETARADRAKQAASGITSYMHADAVRGDGLAATYSGDGASVLWLNPPYDFARGERFEARFLRRWGAALAAGGQLVLIVPDYSLGSMREELTAWFDGLEVLRYPDPLYSQFKQVVVLGTRRVLRTEPGELPAFTELLDEPAQLRTIPHGQLEVSARALDVPALVALTNPPEALRKPATPTRVGLAMPPKPAHIAMALGSGIFNGVRLSAPGRDDLLAKAVFRRSFVTVDEKTNEKGEISKLTQVEKPQLQLTTLNLRTGEFAELSPGTQPSDKRGPDGLPAIENFADLLLAYGEPMVSAMRDRCPSLHEGADDVALPTMARSMFPAQANASRAALKLLARGETPLILGEIGSGKTSVAAQVLWSLHKGIKVPELPSNIRDAFPAIRLVQRVRRALVVCPPHLVQNWIDELRKCLPSVLVRVVEQPSDLAVLSSETAPLAVGILSRESAKLGHAVDGVAGRCPKCGAGLREPAEKLAAQRATCEATIHQPLDMMARIALDMSRLSRLAARSAVSLNFEPLRRAAAVVLLKHLALHTTRLADRWESKKSHLDSKVESSIVAALGLCSNSSINDRVKRCLGIIYRKSSWMISKFEHKVDDKALLIALSDLGKWSRRACGEPLYQAAPRPRRYPLADLICKRYPKLFQLVIPDEFHEYSTEGSAQERALHRLTEKIPIALPLTGSLMNGYAKSLFRNLWAVSRRMREEFGHNDAGKFARLYGYQKRVLTGDAAKEAKVAAFGSASDRVVKVEGGERTSDAPGVLPSFVLRHVLPLSVTLHKRDIMPDNRVVDHDRQEIAITDAEHSSRGQHLGAKLKDAVKRDRFDELLAGKLFGQLAEYPSYYDRASADTGNTPAGDYEIRYPEDVGGMLVARAGGLPAERMLAKEEWFVRTLHSELAEGRNVLVFLWHKELAGRLQRLCKEAGEVPAFLDATKVPARKRQEWIDKNVVGKRRVLITNPSCVQTGLNNLIWFSSAVFFENPGVSPFIARQAVGRLDRITQTKEVRVFWPVYEGVQCALLDLLQNKTAISQQIDGIDPSAALEMAGGGESTAQALDVGLAVYKYLGGD